MATRDADGNIDLYPREQSPVCWKFFRASEKKIDDDARKLRKRF
jgi:hypothetical protein